MLQHYDVISIY